MGAGNVREGYVLKAKVRVLIGHARLLGAPQPAEAMEQIKPPSQTDDSARVYRDTKLRPSKTGAKSSQQFRSSSRTNVSRSNMRRWPPV